MNVVSSYEPSMRSYLFTEHQVDQKVHLECTERETKNYSKAIGGTHDEESHSSSFGRVWTQMLRYIRCTCYASGRMVLDACCSRMEDYFVNSTIGSPSHGRIPRRQGVSALQYMLSYVLSHLRKCDLGCRWRIVMLGSPKHRLQRT